MRNGRIVAVRDRMLVDQGAYNSWGIVQPYNTVAHMLGLFRVTNFHVEARTVLTNKTPHAPYRGAGRPEAVFVMDRIVDRLPRPLHLDPAGLPPRKFIPAGEVPYRTGQMNRDGKPGLQDTGNFPQALRKDAPAL